MTAKNLLLAVFASLTVAFALLTVGEYYQVNTLNSELNAAKSISAQTLTTTVISTAPCPSMTACATFTYAPTGELRVDSVQAMIYGQHVVFSVTVENIGNSQIYFESYELNSSIAANSAVIRGPCNCPPTVGGLVTLKHGQNFTLADPWSGDQYVYQLVQAG